LTYKACFPYPVLWPDDSPFYGPFDRRRWPATAEKVAEFRFEPTSRNDKTPALQMQWVVIDADGGFCLRVEWNLERNLCRDV
jgi:hypothetical protein